MKHKIVRVALFATMIGRFVVRGSHNSQQRNIFWLEPLSAQSVVYLSEINRDSAQHSESDDTFFLWIHNKFVSVVFVFSLRLRLLSTLIFHKLNFHNLLASVALRWVPSPLTKSTRIVACDEDFSALIVILWPFLLCFRLTGWFFCFFT